MTLRYLLALAAAFLAPFAAVEEVGEPGQESLAGGRMAGSTVVATAGGPPSGAWEEGRQEAEEYCPGAVSPAVMEPWLDRGWRSATRASLRSAPLSEASRYHLARSGHPADRLDLPPPPRV